MEPKRRTFTVLNNLLEIAPQIGAIVTVEPEWKEAIRIQFKNGAVAFARSAALDINHTGAAAVARDKGYARFFMEKAGYPVAKGCTFFRSKFRKSIGSNRDESAACAFASAIGFPVIVKPNSGTQGGGVFMAENEVDVRRALASIFREHTIALIEKFVEGRDFRIVVLDGAVVAAYERIPLSVTGDGVSTIAQLFTRKMRSLREHGRTIPLSIRDSRITHALARQNLTSASVPTEGSTIPLLTNANLSSGGDMRDCTDTIHPEFQKIATSLTRDMGLRLSGVDIISRTDISEAPEKYAVLEINATPGLTHFASLGEEQKHRVADIYLAILRILEKSC